MLVTKGRPNRLGVAGWLGGGRWGFERYLYTLHRVTGLGLLAYFVMHIGVTTFRAFGPEAWEWVMGAVSGPLFKIGEYLVFLAFAFPAVNGAVYPYRTSVDVQRPLAIGVMILAAIIAGLGGVQLLESLR